MTTIALTAAVLVATGTAFAGSDHYCSNNANESYVFDIMGEPADKFTDTAYAGTIQPLDKKKSFAVPCRKLPVIMSQTVAMASINVKPWGVQVAGNFRRGAAINQ